MGIYTIDDNVSGFEKQQRRKLFFFGVKWRRLVYSIFILSK